ncbi:hypothetical protein DM02DRAFT_34096 [Periconia macrospinosa]|uniref:Uncharacterized protein n=1 Tax=Periconia macrospinosa TaxID=97972 RepID=A0A2V1EA11_9PLEO|nr:hypothetical protein DM02DRAFT_34096 [Periconia macrospinosa]
MSNEDTDLWYGFKVKQVKTEKNGQISYGWQQITSFSSRFTEGDGAFIMCLDFPKALQTQLRDKVASGNLYCPWKWQVLFIETMRDFYDSSVWSLRDCVRKAEKSRPKDVHSENFQPDFVYLHDMARHVDHSNETLDIAVDTVRCVRKSSRVFDSSNPTQSLPRDERPLEFQDRLFGLEKELKGIKRRSESLAERLRNEINLAFSLVAQRDSRVMVEMGQDSKSDNKNMRSIAIVGLIYLPGTFMSGLFGMSFFELVEDGRGNQVWQTSERLWLYWAITIPLTLFTILIWVTFFHGKALKRRVQELGQLTRNRNRNRGSVEVKA